MFRTKVLVLGGTGMLGSMVVNELSKDPNIELTATARNWDLIRPLIRKDTSVNWEYFDCSKFPTAKMLCKYEYIINCIGITKPYVKDDNMDQIKNAITINSLFPIHLNKLCQELKIRCIQIATDCVYSGLINEKTSYVDATFSYTETAAHDALDVYGKTKSMGEVKSPNYTNLRCSIIGPELYKNDYLLHWFIKQKQNANVNGFINHLWNGITTYHFAKICRGLIIYSHLLDQIAYIQHIVPKDIVTKAQMLKYFAKYFNREDITINEIEAPTKINRVLSTVNPEMNEQIWKAAGYDTVPTIEEMIKELSIFKQEN